MSGLPGNGGLQAFASDVVRVEKPWGYELIWARSDRYCGKLLFVRAGEALSLQFHEAKDETIYVHEGRVEIEIGESARDRVIEVVERGRAFRVRPGIVHRMRALADTTFFEASTPELDDVVRLEDRYGRTSGLAER